MSNLAPYKQAEYKIPEAIELFDEDKVNSVVNLVSETVRDAVILASKARPELFLMDERELFKALSKEKSRPGATDNRLRIKFWDEYDRTHFRNSELKSGVKMDMTAIFAGVCTKNYFYNKYIKNPTKIAWLLNPPTGYITKMEEMLSFGIEQFRDILDLPHLEMDSQGEIIPSTINTKLLGIKAKIVAMVQERVQGAVVQKSVNLSFNTGAGAVGKTTQAITMEEMDKRLAALDKRDKLKPQEEEEALVINKDEEITLVVPEEK